MTYPHLNRSDFGDVLEGIYLETEQLGPYATFDQMRNPQPRPKNFRDKMGEIFPSEIIIHDDVIHIGELSPSNTDPASLPEKPIERH